MRTRHRDRSGIAAAEFAVCAPLILIIGFGLIHVGFMVQMKHNSKMIGHLAATEVFKANIKNSTTIDEIEAQFGQMADDLGIQEFEVEILQHSVNPDIIVVNTSVSVAENSPVPNAFLTGDNINTSTYLYSTLE